MDASHAPGQLRVPGVRRILDSRGIALAGLIDLAVSLCSPVLTLALILGSHLIGSMATAYVGFVIVFVGALGTPLAIFCSSAGLATNGQE